MVFFERRDVSRIAHRRLSATTADGLRIHYASPAVQSYGRGLRQWPIEKSIFVPSLRITQKHFFENCGTSSGGVLTSKPAMPVPAFSSTSSCRSSNADRSSASSALTRSPIPYRFSIAAKNAVASPALSNDRVASETLRAFPMRVSLWKKTTCSLVASTVAARGHRSIHWLAAGRPIKQLVAAARPTAFHAAPAR